MLFHISLDLFHMPCLDNFVLSRPAGTGLGSLTCPQCKVLTPMITLHTILSFRSDCFPHLVIYHQLLIDSV